MEKGYNYFNLLFNFKIDKNSYLSITYVGDEDLLKSCKLDTEGLG